MKNKEQKNREYWKKRAEQRAEKNFRRTDDYIARLKIEYQEAYYTIQKDIEVFYQRFAQNNELSLMDAKKLLNSDQLSEFKMSLKQFTRLAKDNDNLKWEKELNNVYFKTRVTRLQALQTQIKASVESLFIKQENDMTLFLSSIYEDTYYRNIYELQKGLGLGVSFARIDRRTLETVIKEKWLGENYSSRLWKDRDKLLRELEVNLSQAFIRGDSIDKTASIIAERMKVASNRARTLVNTESAYISNKSTFESFKASGVVKEYEIIATLDLKTSDICRSMDGKIFKLSEKEIGINAPPFHPNCRTVIVAYFEDMDTWLEERIARDPETGKGYMVWSDMTYNKWYEKYVKDKEDIPKYEEKVQTWIDEYKKAKRY